MSEHLFRQEAVNCRQEERLWGHGLVGTAPAHGVVTGVLLSLFIMVLLFLLTGEYRRKVVVTGTLVPDKGAVQVRSPADGMVEQVLVGLGDRVGKGDTVLRLWTGNGQVHGARPSNRLLKENGEQTRLIRQQLKDLILVTGLKRKALLEQQQNLESRQTGLESLARDEARVLALFEQKFRRLASLQDSGFVSRSDLESAHVDLLKQQGRLGQIQLQQNENAAALDEINDNLGLLDVETRDQEGRLNRSLSELRQEKVRIEAGSFQEVISPVAGTIAEIGYSPGQAVINRQALVTVIPEGATLEAELYVPSRASGFLKAAMPVSLRLDAFPHQKFGQVGGTVGRVAGAITMPNEISRAGSETEPYYRATAILDSQSIQAWGEEFAFRAGMRLEADIQLESRTLLEWLLEPLFIRRRGV